MRQSGSFKGKSTPTTYYDKGKKPFTYFSKYHQKEIKGHVIKEKTGHIWVDFGNNNIHRFCKYNGSLR